MIFERGNGSEKIIDAFAPKLGDLLSRGGLFVVVRTNPKSL